MILPVFVLTKNVPRNRRDDRDAPSATGTSRRLAELRRRQSPSSIVATSVTRKSRNKSAPWPAQSPTLSPDVVGDHGGVTRIVLRNAGFDFPTRSARRRRPREMPPPRRARSRSASRRKRGPRAPSGSGPAGSPCCAESCSRRLRPTGRDDDEQPCDGTAAKRGFNAAFKQVRGPPERYPRWRVPTRTCRCSRRDPKTLRRPRSRWLAPVPSTSP